MTFFKLFDRVFFIPGDFLASFLQVFFEFFSSFAGFHKGSDEFSCPLGGPPSSPEGPNWSRQRRHEEDEEEELSEEQVANMSDSELLAFVRSASQIRETLMKSIIRERSPPQTESAQTYIHRSHRG